MSKCNQKILLKSTQMPICYGFDLFFVVLEQFVSFQFLLRKILEIQKINKPLLNESCAGGEVLKILVCGLFKCFLSIFG